jgi:LPS export ABC transporter protein LptC
MSKNIIIILTFVSILFAMFSCKENTGIIFDENTAKQSMKNAEIIYTDSGALQMVTFGPEVVFLEDEDQTQIFPKGAKATFYNVDGKVSSIITADSAVNNRKNEIMHLMKNVVIKNFDEGHTTYSEDFWWDQKASIIYSDLPVLQIYDNGDRNRGTGFTANEDMSNFHIKNPRFEGTY